VQGLCHRADRAEAVEQAEQAQTPGIQHGPSVCPCAETSNRRVENM
jgi:hypothetical protein